MIVNITPLIDTYQLQCDTEVTTIMTPNVTINHTISSTVVCCCRCVVLAFYLTILFYLVITLLKKELQKRSVVTCK